MSKIKYCTYAECPVCRGKEYVTAVSRVSGAKIIKTCELCRERTIKNWKHWGVYQPDWR